MRYRPGDVTEAVRDGIATTLIRGGIASLVEEPKAQEDVPPVKPDADDSKQADSDHASGERTDHDSGSKTPTVPSGVGHKPRRRNSKSDSSGS